MVPKTIQRFVLLKFPNLLILNYFIIRFEEWRIDILKAFWNILDYVSLGLEVALSDSKVTIPSCKREFLGFGRVEAGGRVHVFTAKIPAGKKASLNSIGNWRKT